METVILLIACACFILLLVILPIMNGALNHKCEQCGSRSTLHSCRWIRGLNKLSEHSYGDCGAYCYDCGHITWDVPLEEHVKTLPSWCVPYNDQRKP